MNYAEIKERDIANGEGIRVSLFVSGCTHHCEGCFNAMTWDFNYGEPFTEAEEEKILELLKPPFVDGLTLLGGEPMEPSNQRALVPFLRKVKARYPEKTIWCYSGYTYEADLLGQKEGSRARCEVTDEMLSMIDVLVDGEFVLSLKDITLLFRGSSNQRLLKLTNGGQSAEPYVPEM